MTNKTHSTAVVIIPPEDVWEPIQAIRREHDRQVRRWMPHVTLLYPFRPREEFDALAEQFSQALREVEPFEVRLAKLCYFEHGEESLTLWLAPQPPGPLVKLHETLWGIVPDCDEVRRHREGFTPHLSVGQAKGREKLKKLRLALQPAWRPVSFTVREVSLIERGDPPDDVFRAATTVPLAGDRRNSEEVRNSNDESNPESE